MAKKLFINKDVKKSVKKFGEIIEKEGIPISKLIIFGSYAKKKATKYSDIDVCVVSPKFGKDMTEEMKFLFKKSYLADSRIEPYPLSPKEYKSSISPIVYEIKKYGKAVK